MHVYVSNTTITAQEEGGSLHNMAIGGFIAIGI